MTPSPQILMQATVLSNGQMRFSGPWFEDRQRCDDFLLECWMHIRQYHAKKEAGPAIDVPDNATTKKLLALGT